MEKGITMRSTDQKPRNGRSDSPENLIPDSPGAGRRDEWRETDVKETFVIIQNDLDIVTARSMVRDFARSLGFGPIDQARIATAVSELACNIFLYAGKGTVIARKIVWNERRGIEIEFQDNGPGIPDTEKVLQDDYVSHQNMWTGLPGAKRLMDEFQIHSHVGVGTTVICRKWRK